MGDQVPGQYYLSTICIAGHLFSEDWQFWGDALLPIQGWLGLLNKERLSSHRQARWFFGPRKMGGQVPGQVLFEHQVLCVALPGAILNQSKKWWPWHATYGKVVAEIHVHTELSYFTPSACMQMFKSYPKHAELLSTEFCWHIIGVLGTALWNLTSVSCFCTICWVNLLLVSKLRERNHIWHATNVILKQLRSCMEDILFNPKWGPIIQIKCLYWSAGCKNLYIS